MDFLFAKDQVSSYIEILNKKRMSLVVVANSSGAVFPNMSFHLGKEGLTSAFFAQASSSFEQSLQQHNNQDQAGELKVHQVDLIIDQIKINEHFENNLVLTVDSSVGQDVNSASFVHHISNYGVITWLGKNERAKCLAKIKTVEDYIDENLNYGVHSRVYGIGIGRVINLRSITVAKNTVLHIADVEVVEDKKMDISVKEQDILLKRLLEVTNGYLSEMITSNEQREIAARKLGIKKAELNKIGFTNSAYYVAAFLGLEPSFANLIKQDNDPVSRVIQIIAKIEFSKEQEALDNKIKESVRHAVENNQKEFYINEQIKALRAELNNGDNSGDEQLERRIKNSAMPSVVKEKALQEFKKYLSVSSMGAESYVIRNYIDWLVNVPWSGELLKQPSVKYAKKVLEESHFGLEKVKEKILEYIAVLERSKGNVTKAPIICLIGPPGIGKTSLGESIAKSLDRRFIRLSLGGVQDEAEIRGHRRTYVGSMPGKIIQKITKAGVNNPLFLLDEIDKMSNGFRGDPAAALLEVLDPEQNKTFNDHFLEVDYDLSNVLFLATSNSYNIPEPLLDRMEVIDLGSYTHAEKFHIAKNHLIPRVFKNNFVAKGEIKISDKVLNYLINGYTLEPGVRNLEKRLQNIVRYIIKERALNQEKSTKVTERLIEKILGPKPIDIEDRKKLSPQVGEITGLAYNTIGGSILQIEVATMPGKGKIQHTGSLGDNIKESVNYAISAIRTSAYKWNIDPDFYKNTDIHVHFPNAATKKDGPSAGAAITTAIISSLTNKKIPSYVGMTGEISLRGKVLKIGGIKEKTMAAYRNGITHIILPKSNYADLYEVPEEVRTKMKFFPVEHINDILPMVFEEKFKEQKQTTS